MRLLAAIVLDLLLFLGSYASLVLLGVDPFIAAFGLLIFAGPLIHLLVARALGITVGGRSRRR